MTKILKRSFEFDSEESFKRPKIFSGICSYGVILEDIRPESLLLMDFVDTVKRLDVRNPVLLLNVTSALNNAIEKIDLLSLKYSDVLPLLYQILSTRYSEWDDLIKLQVWKVVNVLCTSFPDYAMKQCNSYLRMLQSLYHASRDLQELTAYTRQRGHVYHQFSAKCAYPSFDDRRDDMANAFTCDLQQLKLFYIQAITSTIVDTLDYSQFESIDFHHFLHLLSLFYELQDIPILKNISRILVGISKFEQGRCLLLQNQSLRRRFKELLYHGRDTSSTALLQCGYDTELLPLLLEIYSNILDGGASFCISSGAIGRLRSILASCCSLNIVQWVMKILDQMVLAENGKFKLYIMKKGFLAKLLELFFTTSSSTLRQSIVTIFHRYQFTPADPQQLDHSFLASHCAQNFHQSLRPIQGALYAWIIQVLKYMEANQCKEACRSYKFIIHAFIFRQLSLNHQNPQSIPL